jgi:hypothetical protein
MFGGRPAEFLPKILLKLKSGFDRRAVLGALKVHKVFPVFFLLVVVA